MENLIKRNPMTHQYRPPHQLYLRAVCSSKAKPPEKEKKTQAVSFALISWVFHFFRTVRFSTVIFWGGCCSRFSGQREMGNGESQEAFWVVIATQLTRHFTCRIRVLAAIFALIALYFASLFAKRYGTLPCTYTLTCICIDI